MLVRPKTMNPASVPAQADATPVISTATSAEDRTIPRILLTRPTGVQFLKGSFAGIILLTALYAVVSQRSYVSSNNAVASARVASVRVPINGYLKGFDIGVGAKVLKQERIGHVEDSLVDDANLLQLRQAIQQKAATTDSDMQLRDRLVQERRSLEIRGRDFVKASTSRLQELVRQDEQQVASGLALKNELRLELDRQRKLYQEGITARAELDVLQRRYGMADHDLEAERNALGAVQIQANASAHGILLDSGTNGGSYAQQRIDEIDMRLAEIDQMVMQSQKDEKAMTQTLADAGSNLDLRRSGELFAPVNGIVWKLIASDGEYVEKGASVAQFVDCKSAFILAAIPQDRVPDVALGSTVRFRFAGDTFDRYGKVRSVSGEQDELTNAALAAAPVRERTPTATVLISQNQIDTRECVVGRTARVLIPVASTHVWDVLGQWIR